MNCSCCRCFGYFLLFFVSLHHVDKVNFVAFSNRFMILELLLSIIRGKVFISLYLI